MKRFLVALAPVGWFLLGTPVIAVAEPGAPEATVVQSVPAAGQAALNKEKPVKAKRKKPKPFTPEQVKRAEANKKKVEWWEMPKPRPSERRRSAGRSHMGH